MYHILVSISAPSFRNVVVVADHISHITSLVRVAVPNNLSLLYPLIRLFIYSLIITPPPHRSKQFFFNFLRLAK
jgi:hypothetical protein